MRPRLTANNPHKRLLRVSRQLTRQYLPDAVLREHAPVIDEHELEQGQEVRDGAVETHTADAIAGWKGKDVVGAAGEECTVGGARGVCLFVGEVAGGRVEGG